MIKDKEYPATHSMSTAWFAIDEDGNVAIMDCEDNGPAPVGIQREECPAEFLVQSFISDKNRIAYTDKQLSKLMTYSGTPMEIIQEQEGFEYSDIFLYSSLCEIDPNKIDLLKEVAALSSDNILVCVSPQLNLWFIDFMSPQFIETYPTIDCIGRKQNIKPCVYAKTLYDRLFIDGVIQRVVRIQLDMDPEEEEKYPRGWLRSSVVSFFLYHQGYDDRKPSERLNDVPSERVVHESQLSEAIRKEAIRLPLKFREHDRIQIAAYIASYFYGSSDDWLVDGETAQIVKLQDGNFYFVGDRCYFKPIPIEEGLKSPNVRLKTPWRAGKEYRINGRRGYIKERDGSFRKAGSFEPYTPKATDIIERVDYDDMEEDDED